MKRASSGAYRSLFIKREFRALLGPGYGYFVRLVALMMAMLLALGISLGGLEQLRIRMDDPFTNTLEVAIPLGSGDLAQEAYDSLMVPDVREALYIEGGEFSQVTLDWLLDMKLGEARWFRNRSLAVDSRLTHQLLTDPDLLYRDVGPEGLPERPSDQCGLIVTEETVRQLGLDPHTLEALPFRLEGNEDSSSFTLFLPVFAIVKQLPGGCDLAMPDPMAVMRNEPYERFVRPFDRNNQVSLLVPDLDEDEIRARIESSPYAGEIYHVVSSSAKLDDHYTYTQVTLSLREDVGVEKRQVWRKRLEELAGSADRRVLLTYPWYCDNEGENRNMEIKKYRLNLFFSQLDNVREFELKLNEVADGLSIDMSRIESSRNFSLVARLTAILSAGLFLFCLLGMVFYMNHMVQNHLYRNRQGLGTLAAFGLSRRDLNGMYSQIIILYTVFATGFGFLLVLMVKGILELLGTASYLVILHPYLFVAILLGWGVVILSTRRSIHQYLQKTPGDLIFNR